MQHCPRCLAEYREGFDECSDCRRPLAPGPPPHDLPPDPDLELVTVFECFDPVSRAWAEGLLRDAAIPHFHRSESPECGTGIAYAIPFTHARTLLLVARDREAEARALLEPIEEIPEPSAEEAGEVPEP